MSAAAIGKRQEQRQPRPGWSVGGKFHPSDRIIAQLAEKVKPEHIKTDVII